MCGIGGVYVKDPNAKVDVDLMLEHLLVDLDHRGGDACGFVAVTDDGIAEWQKAAVEAKTFNRYRRLAPKNTRVLMMHTRWATQGHQGFMENNHPIRRGPFLIVHNGHISNDREVFKLAGRWPYGQVDSESIAAHLAKQGSLERLPKTMEALYGAAAVAAIDDRHPKKLAIARGYGSPMYVLETRRVLIFGSTSNAVLNAHHFGIGRIKKEACESLDEGAMLLIDGNKVTDYSFKPQEVSYFTPKNLTLATTVKPKDNDGDLTWCRCDVCDQDVISVMRNIPDVDGIEWLVCEDCYLDLGADDDELFSTVVEANPAERLSDGWEDDANEGGNFVGL